MSTPYSPQPSAAHSELIDALGGPSAVAGLVSRRVGLDKPMTSQMVSNWRRRGVPWRHRGFLASVARERDIGVPPGFLGEDAAPRAEA